MSLAPHGRASLTFTASACEWIAVTAPGPSANTLGIWKYRAAVCTSPRRSACDQPEITATAPCAAGAPKRPECTRPADALREPELEPMSARVPPQPATTTATAATIAV